MFWSSWRVCGCWNLVVGASKVLLELKSEKCAVTCQTLGMEEGVGWCGAGSSCWWAALRWAGLVQDRGCASASSPLLPSPAQPALLWLIALQRVQITTPDKAERRALSCCRAREQQLPGHASAGADLSVKARRWWAGVHQASVLKLNYVWSVCDWEHNTGALPC